MARKRERKSDDEALAPLSELEQAMRKVLSNTKEDSDRQLKEFQAANVRRRETRQERKE